jgi:hypothetical protein
VTTAPEQAFVLMPPHGWLNRVDEVLRAHGVTVTGQMSEDLGDLVRSWRVHSPARRDLAGEVMERERLRRTPGTGLS